VRQTPQAEIAMRTCCGPSGGEFTSASRKGFIGISSRIARMRLTLAASHVDDTSSLAGMVRQLPGRQDNENLAEFVLI